MGIRWYHLFLFAAGIVLLALFMLPAPREEGILLARSGKSNQALRMLREIIKNNPNDTIAILELAEGLMKGGEPVQANQILDTWLKSNPDIDAYRFRLAKIYEAGFEFEKALNILAGAPEPDYKRLVELAVRGGMLDRAIGFLRDEIKIRGNRQDLWEKIALYQNWQLNINGVGEAINEIARIKPDAKNLTKALNYYFWRGDTENMKRFAKALEGFDELSLNQLRLLRTVWIKTLNIKSALASAKRIITNDKAGVQDWNDYAALLDWDGQTAQALASAEAAIKKFKDEESPVWQAVAFARKLNQEAIAAKYLYYIGQKTKRDDIIRIAADTFARAGEEKQAIKVYRELAERNKNSYDLLRLATLLEKNGDKAQAKNYAKQFYQSILTEKDADVTTETLAEGSLLLESVGLGNEQEALLQRLAQRGDYNARILIANIYYDAGKTRKALEILSGIPETADGTVRRQAAALTTFILNDEFNEEPDKDKAKKLRKQVIAAADAALLLYEQFKPEANDLEEFNGILSIRFDFALIDKNLILAASLIKKMRPATDAQYVELSAVYAENNFIDKAKEYAAKVINPAALEPNTISRLAATYLVIGENKKALQYYLIADKKANSKIKDIRLGLATAYGANGDIKKQYEIYDSYANSPKATSLDVLAAADARGGNDDILGETRVLKNALRRFAKSAIIRSRLISNLNSLGYIKEAKKLSWGLEGLKLRKDITEIISVVYALIDTDQLREAGRLLAATSKMEDPNLDLVLAKARLLSARRDLAKALQFYKYYLSRKPREAIAWYEMAQVKQGMGTWGARQDALRAEQIISAKKRLNSVDWILLSGVNNFLGRRKSSLIAMSNAKKAQPNVPVRTLELAALYNTYGIGKWAEQELKQLGPDSEIDRTDREMGTAQISQRKFARAIKTLKKFVANNPDDADASADIGYSENELGRWKHARKDFSTAQKIINHEFKKETQRVFVPLSFDETTQDETEQPKDNPQEKLLSVYRQSKEIKRRVFKPLLVEDLPEFEENPNAYAAAVKARALLSAEIFSHQNNPGIIPADVLKEMNRNQRQPSYSSAPDSSKGALW